MKSDVCKIILCFSFLEIPIVFVDEYSLSEQSLKRYNWIKKGEDDYLVTDKQKKSFTVIAAVDRLGIVHIDILLGPVNSKVFSAFITTLEQKPCLIEIMIRISL